VALRDPVARKAYRRAYRAKHAKVIAERKREWKTAHPNHMDAYKAAHREEQRVYAHARRARLRGALGTHTAKEWLEKIALYAGRCFYCGEIKPLTRDHMIPLSRGGTNAIDNIAPACGPCNRRKGTMTATEFLAR
jgi:5-methylcytosine-specific restriction endonuclease McrA